VTDGHIIEGDVAIFDDEDTVAGRADPNGGFGPASTMVVMAD
jgi:hypothetical protein